ncbi:hypothetical protein JZO73_15200, partial [Enterococcus plantarum]|nr:hypothetical protein [Enterococcus plantarum]
WVKKGKTSATAADIDVTLAYNKWLSRMIDKYGLSFIQGDRQKGVDELFYEQNATLIKELATGIDSVTGKKLTQSEMLGKASLLANSMITIGVMVKGVVNVGKSQNVKPRNTNKKASGANVPKLSTLTEVEQLKLANQYKKKSPINIPESANIKAQSKNGYEQISYKWKENGDTIEVRWHTKTPGAPEGQGNTFVVEKTTPGTADGQRRSQQILVGKDKWVSKNDWQKAITDRKNGVSTPEQDKMLTDGHWKE